MHARTISLIALGLGLSACDPVLDARRAALGPETPGVHKGPLHRAGEPCLVCHRDGGEGLTFSVAGTLYRDPSALVPVANAVVSMLDAAHEQKTVTTNCVGNFYIEARRWSPTLPMWASVRLGAVSIDMESAIHLTGDCASCHGDPVGPASAGHVFLTEDPAIIPTIPIPSTARCDDD